MRIEQLSETLWSATDEAGNEYQVAMRRGADAAAVLATLAEAESPPAVATAADVRAEASRRMRDLLGARDAAHLEILIANGTREAVRLLRVRSARPWTEEEAARAAYLEASDTAIEAIRAASNEMEASPPADYQADARWPALTLSAARP